MAEENKHQEEENKEISSTQTTDEQKNEQQKEKVITALPETTVKPNAPFKLFSFSGDHSGAKIMNWIRVYESLAKRVDWSEEEMRWNLVSYLEQEAFDYYVEHVLSKNLEWKQARQSLVQRFDQYEIDPFMQFLSYKWTPHTEMKEYFRRMRSLGVAAGLKEDDILSGLTRGLPVHLRPELQFVTSLQQWYAVAFCLQQRLEEHGSNYNHKSWKGRRNGRRQPSKQRQNHQQNLQNDHRLSNANNSNDHHNDS